MRTERVVLLLPLQIIPLFGLLISISGGLGGVASSSSSSSISSSNPHWLIPPPPDYDPASASAASHNFNYDVVPPFLRSLRALQGAGGPFRSGSSSPWDNPPDEDWEDGEGGVSSSDHPHPPSSPGLSPSLYYSSLGGGGGGMEKRARVMGSEFLGKRRLGSEFLGRRKRPSATFPLFIGGGGGGGRGDWASIWKRARLGSEFLGR